MEDDTITSSIPTSDEVMSEGMMSDAESDFGSMNTSIEDFDRWQAHIGLKTFGEGLNAAAKAIFPNESRSRYTKVYVLMLSWADEDPNLPVSIEILKLFKVFKDIYHFDVEVWKIPDEACHLEVNQKVLDFVKLGGDSDDHLKIVYYAGHARLTKNRRLAWTSGRRNRQGKSPTVQWSGIQNALEHAQSDVLILLDCCHAGTANNNEGNGVTELIAACAYNSLANGVGSFSFTRELEIELRDLAKLPSFSIGNLYHNIFCRIQARMSDDERDHPAPVYLPLTQEDPRYPRSIRLSVHRDRPSLSTQSTESSFEVQAPDSGLGSGIELPSTPSFLHSSATLPGETPRIAFAIRLQEDFRVGELSSDLFQEWLRNLPASVAEVKIEAGFHSFSSLLIVSVPICMSIYMPRDPAVISLGPITSFNQVLNRVGNFIPKDLPTPKPDQWSFDRISTPEPSPRDFDSKDFAQDTPTLKVNGINGAHNKPSVRFRKHPETISRPPLDRGSSSQFSIASSIDDGPLLPNGLKHPHTIPGGAYPFEKSHPIETFGPHASEANGPQSRAHAKIKSYKDDPETKAFPRISRPVELLRNEYDCIVIGSGYGGGVAASRMARAGQSVCLLERGKERWPGEYPSGFLDAVGQLHVSGEFAPGFLKGAMVEGGDPTGLYHLICGKGQNAFVGNGLGGTSLLNANVFLEADDKTMKMDAWPRELRKPNSLKPYYDRAASVLEPEEYPQDWPDLPKLTMLEKQAQALGMGDKFRRVKQTTRFKGGPNSTGVEMYPSALTGMDCTGVNDGSKSSTLVNYLSDAWNWGAEMFCECEVRYIKKPPPDSEEDGYIVFFAWHGANRGAFRDNLYEDLMWVRAKKCVFLGAGSIGTTEILLRSKKLGLSMSDKVGVGMSGNGDILSFGYNCDSEVNGIGRQYPSPYKPVGPTITGVIDCREQDNPLDGFVIEEGAIPKALAPLFQTMLEMMPGNQLPKGQTLTEKVKHALAQQGSRFLGPYFPKGSIERTQTYLIMSHDSNQATLTLKDDKPILEFLGVGRSDHVEYLNDLLRQATQAVGGTYVNSPFYACLGQQEITVHPIGGACMSDCGLDGVTNHFGEVFAGNGEETHEGLIVTDGAVIPTALGVNPFATITALAERSVEHAAKLRLGRQPVPIDLETKNDILDLFADPHQYKSEKKIGAPLSRNDTRRISEATDWIKTTRENKASGFGFSEVMSGYIHIGDGIKGDKLEDYETAAKTAKGLCEEARFFLSVKAWDTETIVHRDDHKAMLTGTFTCAGLVGSPFMVQRGSFHLFSVDQQAPGTRNLTYDFDMTSTDNRQFHFHGYKVVDSSVALGPWRFWTAASTLYVTISEAYGEKAVLGRGMMHIRPSDFLSEIFTLKPSGRNLLAKVQSTLSFMGFFARQSASLFLAPFTWQQYPSITYSGYINDTSPDQTIKIIASDGVQTLLHVWEPRNSNIETKNLFMIPGASVDQQIFALPTIEVNAVNYFTRAGYRVFVTVHRICQLMVAENNWTTYDSRLDIRASLEWIRSQWGHEPIYTISHCMGAVAYSSGLLDGTIPSKWIKGISSSQVLFNPIWSPLNMAKVLAGPIPFDKLYKMLGGNWFSCSSTRDDGYFQQLVNQILRFYPDDREEICNNVSCHRCSLVFGRLWNHRNLNEATHRQINRFFGGVNMTLLHLLMQMGYRGYVTTNGPLFSDLTTEKNLKRLKGIPVMLFSGSDNKVLTPESTDKSYCVLRDSFGCKGYSRHVIQGYGHLDCWMGRESYKDVFPVIRKEVDRVCRGEGYKYEEPDWKNDWEGWRGLGKSGGDLPPKTHRKKDA
ncbi:related to cholesterol oxidase precursor [Phialocephala subalpina]|uniref:Cholesterol oxidase n=1 Tax=Phialocephala subalpina TaxID=576137 RepID=A0A1L7XKN6_9HELO|nr:related to cholesterol oxidase precursor [Phialocephala subalpina]